MVYLIFDKILSYLSKLSYVTGQIFIVLNGQVCKINVAVWSHFSDAGWVRLCLDWEGVGKAETGEAEAGNRQAKVYWKRG